MNSTSTRAARGCACPRTALVLLLAMGAAAALAAPAAAQERLTLAEVLRATLAANADIEIARLRVEGQQGALRSARGAFDPEVWASAATTRDRLLSAPAVAADGAAQAGSGRLQSAAGMEYGVGLEQRTRSGLVVSPRVSFTRTGVPGALEAPVNQATAALDLVMPLGRGRGGGLVAAQERAAAVTRRAGADALGHQKAASVLQAAQAFWGYVAAAGRVDVLRQAERRAEKLVEETRTLVDADQRPAVDLLPARANLASRRAARLGGEQEVSQARQALGVAMGIPADSLARLALPDAAFPAAPSALPGAGLADAAVAEALRSRADLRAALTRREASLGLLRGARGERQPKVDLTVRLGYTGVEGGRDVARLLAPLSGERGLHAEVQLSYGQPLGNRAAEGEAARSAAEEREAAVAAAELARRIAMEAATAAEAFRRSAEELELAAEAVRLHAAALEGETQKFRLGTSTLFEVMNAEERLTGATLTEIDGRRRYALALAQLRFETGSLLSGEAGDQVDAATLTRFD